MITIIDLDSDGKINILEFDKMLRDYHRKLLSREEGASDDLDSDVDDLKSVSLVFSPSRVSTKCEHCLIGNAEPPKERNPKYAVYCIVGKFGKGFNLAICQIFFKSANNSYFTWGS